MTRRPPAPAGWLVVGELGAERSGREARHAPLGVDPGHALGQRPQAGQGDGEVGQARGVGGESGPAVDHADGVGSPGAPVALVVVREELGLVRGHVHVDRAVGLAALAGEAQVEGVLHPLVLPPVADDLALEHLEQHPGPTPGGVLLLPGHHVAWAHRPALRPAAQPHADALQGRLGGVTLVVGEPEVGGHGDRVVTVVLTGGPVVIDVGRRRVTVFGREVMLTALELELLSYFLMHPDEPITRARLLEAVWGYSIGGTATVTVHVRRLREKIEVDPANPVLTVWGVGYQFSPSEP